MHEDQFPILTFASNRTSGKSMFLFHMLQPRFKEWYDGGNRVPSNVVVEYYDIEGILPDDCLMNMNWIYFASMNGLTLPNTRVYEVSNGM
jgi:hypothetical protein